MATGSLTAHPGKYLKVDYSFASISNETSPVGKGANNTTYAQITLKTGTNAETWVYWPFDLSAIPSNATIDSVSCSAKAAVSDSYVKSRTIQLYSGATGKGSATDLTTSGTAHNLDCGTWTRAELQDCRLRTYARRGTSSTSKNRYLYFYGADLTVTYTYQSEKFMLKLSGAYNDVARTFKKVSGIWVEQTDLANVIEDGVRYKNGGEYVNPYKTVTITGYGYSSTCAVTINGVKYTSGAKVSALKNTIITLRVWGTSSLPGKIIIDGMKVSEESGFVTYNYAVTENIVLNLERYYISAEGMYQGTITITTQ